MAEGYKDWVAGNVLTAADLEDYTVKQSIMRFADAAARNTAVSAVLTEGLTAYLKDVNSLTVYTGSAWSTIGPILGAGTAWTPALTASVSNPTLGTGSSTTGVYFRLGRLVIAYGRVLFGTSGAAAGSGTYQLSMPVTGTGPSTIPLGAVACTAAGAARGLGWVKAASSTLMNFSGLAGGNASTAADGWTNNDAIGFIFVYEAAADA